MTDEERVVQTLSKTIVDAVRKMMSEYNLKVDDKLANVRISGDNILPLSIDSTKINNGSINAAKVNNLDANWANVISAHMGQVEIDAAQVRDLEAFCFTAQDALIKTANIDWAHINNLSADIATISQAEIGSATIGWAQIRTVTAEATFSAQIIGDTMAINHLVVNDSLSIRGNDDKLYTLTVDSEHSTLQYTPAYMNGASLVDHTVTATQIYANTITANEIAAGTITANEIATNTITANKVQGPDPEHGIAGFGAEIDLTNNIAISKVGETAETSFNMHDEAIQLLSQKLSLSGEASIPSRLKSEPVIDPDTGDPVIDPDTGEPVMQQVVMSDGEYDALLQEYSLSQPSLAEAITSQASLVLDSSGIAGTVSQLQTDVDGLSQNIETYFNFTENGLEIGKNGTGTATDSYKARLDNEKLAFVYYDSANNTSTDVAYISKDEMEITKAHITDQVDVSHALKLGGLRAQVDTRQGYEGAIVWVWDGFTTGGGA